MVKYITGNLFLTKAQVIAHGVNCKGAFGAGIAGQIRRLYPGAYSAYIAKHQKDGWKLGDVQIVELFKDGFPQIANCATQNGYGYTDGQTVFADYGAIERSLWVLEEYCKKNNYTLAIPRIGAGLAGGDWNRIKEIIETIFKHSQVTVEVYSL